MLRIPCPYCGLRDEPEFIFGGPAGVVRPPDTSDDATWTRYLYERENPAGWHWERWSHAHGCGQWFNMLRNTLTHAIVAACPIGVPRPDQCGEMA